MRSQPKSLGTPEAERGLAAGHTSRLATARQRVATARTAIAAGSLIAFCAALLFARVESPAARSGTAARASQAVSTPGTASAAASTASSTAAGAGGSTYDNTYGSSLSQGALSSGSGTPQAATRVS